MQEQVNYLAPVSQASVEDRSQFIWKVYAHVVGIEAYILTSGMIDGLISLLYSNPMITFILFIGSSMGAQYAAHRAKSTTAQYAALAAYVFVFSLIMAPAIYIAEAMQPGVVDSAVGVTAFTSLKLCNLA